MSEVTLAHDQFVKLYKEHRTGRYYRPEGDGWVWGIDCICGWHTDAMNVSNSLEDTVAADYEQRRLEAEHVWEQAHVD